MKTAFSLTVAIAALALGAAGAHAGVNLLTNGGFETGNFTGWTVNANATGVEASGYDGEEAQSGAFFAALGDTSSVYPYGTLSQSGTDTPGQTLTLSYYLMSDGATPNYFDATWDGTVIAGSVLTDTLDQRPDGYVQYVFSVVATGNDTLTFDEQDVPAYLALDNVYLGVGPQSVPEPATWALMLAGFGGLGAALRRRGRSATA